MGQGSSIGEIVKRRGKRVPPDPRQLKLVCDAQVNIEEIREIDFSHEMTE